MAIQNFLSGGFYGKLGDVVGQRWRNKRTIRTHVIPFNPRTEAQQSNRMQFKLATTLAQQAFNINKGWAMWQRQDIGQFSYMVGTAKRRLQKGMSPAEALPLYPDGYKPKIVIQNAVADFSNWSSSASITDDSCTMQEDRQFQVIANCYDLYTNQWVIIQYSHTVHQNEKFNIQFETQNRYVLPQDSTIQAYTTDDMSHGNISITLPMFSVTQPSKATFVLEIKEWEISEHPDAEAIYYAANHPYSLTLGDFLLYIRCRRTSTNNWYSMETRCYFYRENQAIMQTDTEGFTYPNGSKIEHSEYTYSNHPYADFDIIIHEFPFSI